MGFVSLKPLERAFRVGEEKDILKLEIVILYFHIWGRTLEKNILWFVEVQNDRLNFKWMENQKETLSVYHTPAEKIKATESAWIDLLTGCWPMRYQNTESRRRKTVIQRTWSLSRSLWSSWGQFMKVVHVSNGTKTFEILKRSLYFKSYPQVSNPEEPSWIYIFFHVALD